MSVMILHIVVSLIIALGFLGAFIWAIKTNQYDDDYSPSVRILFDDHETKNRNLWKWKSLAMTMASYASF